jgi:L,D-transpeptidase YcbB
MRLKAGEPRTARRRASSRARTAGTAAVLASLLWVAAPAAAGPTAAGATTFQVQEEAVRKSGGEIYTFYAERGYRPLWFDSRGTLKPSAGLLLQLLETAEFDQIDPAALGVAELKSAIEAAVESGTAPSLTRAELGLSRAFVTYAQALRSAQDSPMSYEHDNLRPQALRPYHLLKAAATARSTSDYIGDMGWMHPLYAPLRRSLSPELGSDDPIRQVAISNLARIRGIPTSQRQIIVDVANARLWMYENGRPVDSMRVVVGRPTTRTPLLAGYLRYAIVNPYWNVPDELVSRNIAANVLRQGTGYLKARGYQVLSDWGDDPQIVDPGTINWRAAARGELDLRVRQLPRAGNAMGKVKYEFPNQHGIYLHDTPEKGLLQKDARQFSAGCIRLEDAERLGRWLMQGRPLPESDNPEERVDLPRPVPIYLTYLTAHAENGRIALGPDPYGIDAKSRRTLALGNFERADLVR